LFQIQQQAHWNAKPVASNNFGTLQTHLAINTVALVVNMPYTILKVSEFETAACTQGLLLTMEFCQVTNYLTS
jgi:hypothetical protein